MERKVAGGLTVLGCTPLLLQNMKHASEICIVLLGWKIGVTEMPPIWWHSLAIWMFLIDWNCVLIFCMGCFLLTETVRWFTFILQWKTQLEDWNYKAAISIGKWVWILKHIGFRISELDPRLFVQSKMKSIAWDRGKMALRKITISPWLEAGVKVKIFLMYDTLTCCGRWVFRRYLPLIVWQLWSGLSIDI